MSQPLYLDTSALIKLYIKEPGSGEKLEILFATYDTELKAAAKSEGLKVL